MCLVPTIFSDYVGEVSLFTASPYFTDVLLALIIPLRIVGLRGHLSPYKTVCHGIQYLEQVLITVNLYIILSMSMIRKKYISRGLGYGDEAKEF